MCCYNYRAIFGNIDPETLEDTFDRNISPDDENHCDNKYPELGGLSLVEQSLVREAMDPGYRYTGPPVSYSTCRRARAYYRSHVLRSTMARPDVHWVWCSHSGVQPQARAEKTAGSGGQKDGTKKDDGKEDDNKPDKTKAEKPDGINKQQHSTRTGPCKLWHIKDIEAKRKRPMGTVYGVKVAGGWAGHYCALWRRKPQ